LRGEAGEAVDVQEPFDFRHQRIMAIFPANEKAKFAEKIREKLASVAEIYPHDSTKSQNP
jgi:hypothetical protein